MSILSFPALTILEMNLDSFKNSFIHPRNIKITGKMMELVCATLADDYQRLGICFIFYSKISDSATHQLFLFSIQTVTTIFFAYLT
jgi:hypothetical protein